MNKSLSRLESALLLVAPLLMLLGGVLLVRYDDQGWDGVLAAMAAHPARSDVGWLLVAAGAALTVPPTAALAALVRARRPGLGATALVLTALGWASVPAYAMGGIVMEAMAHAPDRAAQVAVLEQFNDGRGNAFFLAAALGAVGYIVLAVGLARDRVAPAAAAVLIGLGGAGTLLVMAGPIRALLLVAVVLLLAGQAWTVTAGRRTAPASAVAAV
ncbi:hypothetical protein [Frankia sp. Cas3]|uniref:hypothetical protein n=1 Tax=Frankia sp. Cas3 TaxID=3073926 RepID=UPI002AD3087B|nr:hypothetical protein [Frankia sp. Cas3]